jgi:hypothetical protein
MSANIKRWQDRMQDGGYIALQGTTHATAYIGITGKIAARDAEIADLRAELARRDAEALAQISDEQILEISRKFWMPDADPDSDAIEGLLDSYREVIAAACRPAVVSEGQAVYQWRHRPRGNPVEPKWVDAMCEEAYSRVDEHYEARTLYTRPAAQEPEAPADPLDWPLPCDITVGAGTIRKGCTLRTLVARMHVLVDAAKGAMILAKAAPEVPTAAQAPHDRQSMSHAEMLTILDPWPCSKDAPVAEALTRTKPILMAYVATDLDGHADVGMTIEIAKQRAGECCDTIIALHDISTEFVEFEGKVVGKPILAAPATEQANQPTEAQKYVGDEVSKGLKKALDETSPAKPDLSGLTEALQLISDMCPATAEMTLAHEMAQIASEALLAAITKDK